MAVKSLLALAAAAMLAAPAAPPPPKWSDAIPPARFNVEGVVPVVFVHPSKIKDACSLVGEPPEGLVIVACTITPTEGEPPIIVMPHPAFWGSEEWYAGVMAHELAHALAGWKHEEQ